MVKWYVISGIIGYFLIGAIIAIGILVYDKLHTDPFHEEDNDCTIVFILLIWPLTIPAFGFIGIHKLIVKASDHIANIIKERRSK